MIFVISLIQSSPRIFKAEFLTRLIAVACEQGVEGFNLGSRNGETKFQW